MSNTRVVHTPGAHARAVVKKFFPHVKDVVDAEKPLRVTVPERAAPASKRGKHAECAMAVACREQEHAEGVIVSLTTAYVIKGGVAYRYKVPQSVSREIVSFDRHAEFQAGEYHLRAPCESEKLGHDESMGGQRRSGPKRKNIARHMTTNIRTALGSV